MVASTTIGRGVGAAFGKSQNTYEQTLNTKKLVGPHCVATGSVQLTGTTKVITFGYPLEKAASKYVVMATSNNANCNVTGKTDDANSLFSYFTLGGTSADVVEWAVFDTGN